SGRKAFFSEAEDKLYNWIIEQRKQGLAVTYINIQTKMLEILQEHDMKILYSRSVRSFNASVSWLYNFLYRYKLALRRCTKKSQKLPDQTKELLDNFYNRNFTVNLKGEKTIHIRSTNNKKTRFIVVLICVADRTKLSPICIFKRKKLKNNEQIPSDFRKNKELNNTFAMMVYDSFRGHLDKFIKQKFHKNYIDLAIAKGGCGKTKSGNLKRAILSDVCE
ncbi:11440_t:CDS:2, partial [Scutellospora calospora]